MDSSCAEIFDGILSDLCFMPGTRGTFGKLTADRAHDHLEISGVSVKVAKDIIGGQIGAIRDGWDNICEEGALTEVKRILFGKRIFLIDYSSRTQRRACEGRAPPISCTR